MSWQEELRRLDAELAAGRIEPSAHRKQRDELLAQASGSTVPSPVPSPLRRPGGDAWHSANPASWPTQDPETTQTPHAAHAAAPQPRAESTAPAAPAVPAAPYRPQRPPARPQATPPWAVTQKTLSSGGVPAIPDHMTTAPSPADINPTRYLRVDGPAADRPQASRFPPLGPPQARKLPNGNPIDPPAEPAGKHRWEDDVVPAAPARGRPTWLFLSLGVLIVLGMIIGATILLGKDDSTEQATGPTVTPSVPAGAIGSIEERLPQLPGTQNDNNSTMSIARGLELGLYPQTTADVLRRSGATEVIFRGSAVNAGSNLVLIVPTSGVANAESAVEELYRTALANGFSAIQSDLRTAVAKTADSEVRATWYTSGGMIVSIGVAQTAGLGDATLAARLDQAVESMRAVLPPG